MKAERPLVNRSARFVVGHRKITGVYAHAHALRIGVEVFPDETLVAESRGHENVCLTSALNEIARDFLAVADHVLRGSGFMIDVASVDVSAAIHQICGDFHCAGEMEWRLAIAPASVHKRRLSGDEFAQSVHQAEARCSMYIDDRPALDGVFGKVRFRAVQESEASRPPAAFGV